MHSVNIIIIFVIVGLAYVVLPLVGGTTAKAQAQVHVQTQKGGYLELNFSEITDDISTGNNLSWSNKKNVSGPHHSSRPEQKFTFWGHGIPLAHETKLGKQYGQKIPTLSGMNLRCSPECCPSPYSCDGGCVCYHRDRKGGKIGGPTLRKDFTGESQIR